MSDVDNSVGEIVRTGVQSKKNSITIQKRMLNKENKPSMAYLVSVRDDPTASRKDRMQAAQFLMSMHMDAIKTESTEKARNKEFAAKHHELLVSIQRNGGVIVDDIDDDDESQPLLMFDQVMDVDE
jgi:hypothetical protein